MKKLSRAELGRPFALALAVLAPLLVFLPHTDSSDASYYLAMTDGAANVPTPFAYRIAVPLLAHYLPLEPAAALELLALISTAGFLAVITSFLRRLELSADVGCLLAIGNFYPVVYSMLNPHIIDPAFLFLWALAARFIYEDRGRELGVLLWLGVMVKEAIVFAALAYAVFTWLQKRELRAAASAGLWGLPAVIWYVTVRLAIHAPSLGSQFTLPEPRELASGVLLSFLPFVTWIAAGLRTASRRRAHFLVAGAAAVVPMLFLAHDSGRMLGLLLPFWLPIALEVRLTPARIAAAVAGEVLLVLVTVLDLPLEMALRAAALALIAMAPLRFSFHTRRFA